MTHKTMEQHIASHQPSSIVEDKENVKLIDGSTEANQYVSQWGEMLEIKACRPSFFFFFNKK